MSDTDNCTEACKATVRCATCKRPKAPAGRSVPMAAYGSYCQADIGPFACKGYYEDPKPGHLWPNEEIDPKKLLGRT